MVEIIDGRAIAEDMYGELRRAHEGERGRSLGIIVGGADPVIESFVRIKSKAAAALGIEMQRIDLPQDATTDDAIRLVRELAEDTDAIIVQLPLPKQFNNEAILAAIPKEKDVDAINPTVPDSERFVHAPVALAVLEILKRSHVEVAEKKTVVIGAGRLVGAPSAVLLRNAGANVSMVTLEEGSLDDLKDADIVVSGAGTPGLIKPHMLKQGVALIDAGASEQAGKITGDADPSCAEVASVFTPVPRGVGPVAVAMIFRNFYELVQHAQTSHH